MGLEIVRKGRRFKYSLTVRSIKLALPIDEISCSSGSFEELKPKCGTDDNKKRKLGCETGDSEWKERKLKVFSHRYVRQDSLFPNWSDFLFKRILLERIETEVYGTDDNKKQKLGCKTGDSGWKERRFLSVLSPFRSTRLAPPKFTRFRVQADPFGDKLKPKCMALDDSKNQK